MASLRNKTLSCTPDELTIFSNEVLTLVEPVPVSAITNQIIHQNFFDAAKFLPNNFVDLLILDPPYNLTKNYNGYIFNRQDEDEYSDWFESILNALMHTLTVNASIYICSEWRTSILIAPILNKYFFIRNRITWERDKGRGAACNYKNNSEDIWFCTRSEDYRFNVQAIRTKKPVIAPYRTHEGDNRDWYNINGKKFRFTYPSNLWTDITVPFWSMPENTRHPTQKSEKLIAKLILASSDVGHFVFDPFMGSGTTAVVAKKLDRNFCGIELNHEYCCTALKRLQQTNSRIQGYVDGVFLPRNSDG